ncbi:hypothetical protein HZS_3175 [Henneguya salminicola]|nr:hypothetical protein HZS_3175 [Henneguya salminicola]
MIFTKPFGFNHGLLKRTSSLFFRRLRIGDSYRQYHTILIWATNKSPSLLRHNSHTFIDSIFWCTPHPFMQCLILIAYDHGTEV